MLKLSSWRLSAQGNAQELDYLTTMEQESYLWSWHLHHMALGRTIGFSTRLSQNNVFEYTVSDDQTQISTALMGDPTLRLHCVAPVSNLQPTIVADGIQLTWDPSPDGGECCHVYRTSNLDDGFERLTSSPVTEAQFVDMSPLSVLSFFIWSAA